MQDVIRMTCDVAWCHPDEISKIWSLSHPDDLAIPSISSGWLIVDTLCHPGDLPGVGISSGWVTANSLCHPDDILFHFLSSGWLNWGWFLIQMSYGNVIMSSGWDTLPFLSHPDEIANFDFPQHAVALQRFRRVQSGKQHNLVSIGEYTATHLWDPIFITQLAGVKPVESAIELESEVPRVYDSCPNQRYGHYLQSHINRNRHIS